MGGGFFGAVGLGREGGSTFRTVLRACSCVGIRTNCDDDYLLHRAREGGGGKMLQRIDSKLRKEMEGGMHNARSGGVTQKCVLTPLAGAKRKKDSSCIRATW